MKRCGVARMIEGAGLRGLGFMRGGYVARPARLGLHDTVCATR